jgi:hypothetical protein
MSYKAPFPQQGDGIGLTKPAPLKPYVSSTAERYAPGTIVKTWNPEIARDAVGITVGVEDPTEANPRIHVKWMHDWSTELVRAEYLYLAAAEAFCREAARSFHDEAVRKWIADAQKHEAAAREIRDHGDLDEIDEQECLLNESIAETLRECIGDLLYPAKPCAPEEEVKF